MLDQSKVVIIGGGIIGFSIAFYLSQDRAYRDRIVVIDSADELFESASGYAGGFLARDWFAEKAAPLGNLSFDLHRQLAEKHGGQSRWGYAGSHVYSLSMNDAPAGVRGEDWLLAGTSRAQAVGRKVHGHVSSPEEAVNVDGTPAWMTPQTGATWNAIAGIEDCGQVEPRKLCEFLLAECKRRGVEVHTGYRPIKLETDDKAKTTFLMLEPVKHSRSGSFEVTCSDVVIASGCWTPRVWKTLFPKSNISIEIDALAGHSIIYKTPRYVKPFINTATQSKDRYISYAIYCPPTKSWSYSPEAYARLDGQGRPEIWIGGLNNTSTEVPLPELATDSKGLISRDQLKNLRSAAVELTGLKQGAGVAEDDLEVASEALCFRPVSKTGVPILQEMPQRVLGLGRSSPGAKIWVASGHGPWGISLSLGTGVVMSEMIAGRKTSVDVSELRIRLPAASKL
jgi:glycine/D-amino acid oxidase-like deaminating enzyme